jgi:hypothetical protein
MRVGLFAVRTSEGPSEFGHCCGAPEWVGDGRIQASAVDRSGRGSLGAEVVDRASASCWGAATGMRRSLLIQMSESVKPMKLNGDSRLYVRVSIAPTHKSETENREFRKFEVAQKRIAWSLNLLKMHSKICGDSEYFEGTLKRLCGTQTFVGSHRNHAPLGGTRRQGTKKNTFSCESRHRTLDATTNRESEMAKEKKLATFENQTWRPDHCPLGHRSCRKLV